MGASGLLELPDTEDARRRSLNAEVVELPEIRLGLALWYSNGGGGAMGENIGADPGGM
ncbi:hypothetical protein FRC20_001222 [Serendipita sp. 405]|nr:hypothetical protein FRC20_001222 [Serendipita sp. 405]